MKQWIIDVKNKMMIRHKLILISMVVAIFPVVIFSIIITSIYDNNIISRMKISVNENGTLIVDRIQRVLKDTENCSNYLVVNMNKVMEDMDTKRSLSLAEKKAINNELYSGEIIFDEVESIAFLHNSQSIFLSNNNITVNKEKLISSYHLDMVQATNGKSIWFPWENRDFLVEHKDTPVLTLGKKVLQIKTGQTLGYIFINVNIDALEKNLANQLINYQLYDENQSVIISSTSSKHRNGIELDSFINENQENMNKMVKYQGEKYYLSKHEFSDYGWTLVGLTDLKEYNVGHDMMIYIFILIAIAVLIIEFLIAIYLTKIIHKPLMILKAGAEVIASGNFSNKFNFQTQDEIGQLGSSFNYMSRKIKDLIERVDYEAKKKREYELNLLHEQIKPHFLYNTLDIVLKLSEMNRHVESRRAVKKLAAYYRNSLSDSQEIISIEREVKIATDYLELQKIRYEELFTYAIVMEAEVLTQEIPKLTLQPIIENSIYHGLKYIEHVGVIDITGRIQNNKILITIKDNGIGMAEDKCEDIIASEPRGHFGLYAVNHRIKLIYGEDYGIEATSKIGEGTCVSILLPYVNGGMV